MCGIFGAASLAGTFDRRDYDRFVALTNLVRYRGPDATGYLAADLCYKVRHNPERFFLFLGHRRLSIIDLDARSNQPLLDGQDLIITFNGEIFNYLELRDELQALGHTFSTPSDTEVILKLYREFGEEGFDRMNGMWAFALVDLRQCRLILSRDRFSIKPLYYFQTSRGLFFASEIKQLLPLLDRRELNPAAMSAYLEQGLVDHTEETFYKHIYSLKPRHNMVMDLRTRSVQCKPYWDYSVDPDALRSPSEVVEKFRELFVDSVRIRLRSDVKVVGLLSGGLDSSSIVTVAQRFQNLETYSAVARNTPFTEEPFIATLCNAIGIRNTKLSLDSDKIVQKLEQTIYYNDEPVTDLCAVAHHLLLEKMKEESDAVVLLSGQGGDEILMGYLKYFFFYLNHLIRSGKPFTALREAGHSFINGTAIRQFALNEGRRYLRFTAGKTLPYLCRGSHPVPIWEAPDLNKRQILDVERYSVPALTHYEDRNSMAHSQEIRLPFLDHRLVNFSISLPASCKMHHGWSKYILRQSVAELPEAIRWRRDKRWFAIPEQEWLVGRFRPLIEGSFRQSVLEQMGVINASAFLQYYKSLLSGGRNIPYSNVTRTLMAELWARNNIAEVGRDELLPAISDT